METIKIEDHEFRFKKWIGNANENEIETNDLALEGWINPNEFGKLLIRKETGNPLLFEGWKIVESQKV